MNRLARYATFVVLAHAGVVIWHLVVLGKIPPGLTNQQILLAVVAINSLPMVALVLLWAHFPRFAGLLLFVPLAVGLGAGGYEHFLSTGPDNVFHMAVTQWTLPFRVTAVLLLILETLGCLIAIQVFRGVPFSKAEPAQ